MAYRKADADGGSKRRWMEGSGVKLDEERSLSNTTVTNQDSLRMCVRIVNVYPGRSRINQPYEEFLQ